MYAVWIYFIYLYKSIIKIIKITLRLCKNVELHWDTGGYIANHVFQCDLFIIAFTFDFFKGAKNQLLNYYHL